MAKQQTKARTVGSPYGKCNICLQSGVLTYDHVPPKGASITQSGRVSIMTLPDSLESLKSVAAISSSNGLKFRTLCSNCNGALLGSKYDPELSIFAKQVAQLQRTAYQLLLPRKVAVDCKPQRIARAIIGHLLAAEVRQNMNDEPTRAPMAEAMRAYFLDESLGLPPELRVFVWACEVEWLAVHRGIGIARVMGSPSDTVYGDFLKFSPLAFWITFNAPPTVTIKRNFGEFTRGGSGLDDRVPVALTFYPHLAQRPDWPERPDDPEILVLNDARCYIAVVT